MKLCAAVPLLALALGTVAQARDSLGMFGGWGAFRDPAHGPNGPRCYAIAKAQPSTRARERDPYADVATWPRQQVRGQVHFRLARTIAPGSRAVVSLGGQRFELAAGGGDAWAVDRRMDAAIVAAMRSADAMTVSARDAGGNTFSSTYSLVGAATAMDAASVGCARLR